MLHLLQAYRGFAALLVVLFHGAIVSRQYFGTASALSVFDYGWSGVQFFFVLSGFIIYYVHERDIGNCERIGAFLRKRVIRIYPLYIAITLALAPFWLFVPSFGDAYHKESLSLLLSLLLIPQPHQPHLVVAWTLTHEMLFYLLFGTLIVSKQWGRGLLVAWFAATFFINIVDPTLRYPWSFFFSINNVLFGIGILAAMIAARFPWRDSIWWALSCAACFLLSGFILGGGDDSSALVLAFGLFSFALLLQAQSTRLNAIAAKRRVLMLLGDASYAIYLVHYPALSLMCKVLADLPPIVAFCVIVPLAVAAGVVVHILVERPLLEMARNVGALRERKNALADG